MNDALTTSPNVLPELRREGDEWTLHLPPELLHCCGMDPAEITPEICRLRLAMPTNESLEEGPVLHWPDGAAEAVLQRMREAEEAEENTAPWLRLLYHAYQGVADVRYYLPDHLGTYPTSQGARILLQAAAEHIREGTAVRLVGLEGSSTLSSKLETLQDALAAWGCDPSAVDLGLSFLAADGRVANLPERLAVVFVEPGVSDEMIERHLWPLLPRRGVLLREEGAADNAVKNGCTFPRNRRHVSPGTWWAQKENGVFYTRWRRLITGLETEWECFNPSLLRESKSGKVLVAFRTSPTAGKQGTLFMGELSDDLLEFVEPVQRLWAEERSDGRNEEDPRLFQFQGEVWISYNLSQKKAARKYRNSMAFSKLEKCNGMWQSAGPEIEVSSPYGHEREKNWIPFEEDGKLLVVYSFSPWEVREIDLEARNADRLVRKCSGIAWAYGEIRGGSPPIPAPNGNWWLFYHSCCRWPRRMRYFAGAVEMDAKTFLPIRQTWTPLFFEHPAPLNKMRTHVCWPAGALWQGDAIHLALGRNDEECWLGTIPVEELDGDLLDPIVSHANPFLVNVPKKTDFTLEDYEWLEDQLGTIHIEDLLKSLYQSGVQGFEFEDFHRRCSRGLRRKFVDRESGKLPYERLVRIGNGGTGRDCFVTCNPFGNTGRYEASQGIPDSLEATGYNGHFFAIHGGFPNPTGEELQFAGVPYCFKIFLFLEAQKRGFERVIWLDSNCHALNNPQPLFESLETHHALLLSERCHNWPVYSFPATLDLLAKTTGADMTTAQRFRAVMFGLKMGTEETEQIVRDYYEMVNLGTPFLSIFPEEVVLSSIFNKPELRHLLTGNPETPKAFVPEKYKTRESAREAGYYFWHQKYE